MRVLGIDPGTIRLGYGIIEADGGGMKMVACGTVSLSPRTAIEKRLTELHRELEKVIIRHRPDEVAVEEPFVHENVRTALAIGRAEAVALLAAGVNNVPVFRYPPALVKQRVTSFGGAGKDRVQQMVRILLGMKSLPEPVDASDALAIAICHVKEQRLRALGAGRDGIGLERSRLSRRKIGLAMVRRQGRKDTGVTE